MDVSNRITIAAKRRNTVVRNTQESIHLIAATVGSVSFLLIWLATMWGLVLRNGWLLTRIRHATIYGIHQVIALLGLCLGVVHTLTQISVPGGHVRVIDTFVPFLNGVDPTGIGVGVVGLELLIAATVSVLIQRRLGYSRWRALHTLTYCAFLLIVAHILLSGSESGLPWAWGTVVFCLFATVAVWFASSAWMAAVRRRVHPSGGTELRERQSTVNVDARRCARFGFCEQAAPEVFKLRGDGRLSYRASVSDEEIDAVVNAVELCPVRAIALSHLPTSVLTPRTTEPELDDELVLRDERGSRRRRGPSGTVTSLRKHRSAR
jgi:ferredoxin/DMSO/TMAO reductase YedYZ heme-binding membrane subunit